MKLKGEQNNRLYFCDLHIHSKYSRATSLRMNFKEMSRYAEMKGLDLLGTGDFTHPSWFEECRTYLREVGDSGVYAPIDSNTHIRYMITSEVSTVFTFEDKVRKIHHIIFAPNLEVAAQINDRLERFGDLAVDGRPTLEMSAPELVEEVMETSKECMVIPSHIWTPWFSLFGAFSGFDRIDDCYQDQTKNIYAVETGLSSDPPMNWRVSSLDRYLLVSNSDSHSPWPWRLGREANVFELTECSYDCIKEAIMRVGPSHMVFTIETDPSYGKYHWTGHRKCKVSLSPEEAIKVGNICPVCGRRLTKGVSQRVEELADRPPGYVPPDAPGYKHLLPLSEIIQTVKGVSSLNTRFVWEIYSRLVKYFGDEYTVLLEAPLKEMVKIVDVDIAKAIIHVREGKVKIIPGFDGEYGKILLFPEPTEVEKKGAYTLDDYF